MDKNLTAYFIDKAKNEIKKSKEKNYKTKEKAFKNETNQNITPILKDEFSFESEKKAIIYWLGITITKEEYNDSKFIDNAIDKNFLYFVDMYLPEILDMLTTKVMFSSHIGKYTNSKISSSISLWTVAKFKNDGYIRTGNCGEVLEDVSINASYLGYVKFVYIQMDDGNTLLYHFKNDTDVARVNFSNLELSYEEIRSKILSIRYSEDLSVTDNYLKQVFFPIGDDDYHLLSILYPSSGMFLLKDKYSEFYFSDEAKEARDARKNKKYNDREIHDIYDYIEINFGGAQTQNVSFLNGIKKTAYMFKSTPPVLENRDVRLPRYDFFRESLKSFFFRKEFNDLHDVFCIDYNNQNIRDYRDKVVFNIFDIVIEKVLAIRSVKPGWSDTDNYSNLPFLQKQILDSKYDDLRTEENILEFIADVSRWIINSYEKFKFKDHFVLGDLEIDFISDLLSENAEVLL